MQFALGNFPIFSFLLLSGRAVITSKVVGINGGERRKEKDREEGE